MAIGINNVVVKVKNYNSERKSSWSPLVLHGESVCGFWWFGRWYNTSRFNGEYFYGAYPFGFLPRIEILFKEEFAKGKILHLFSGTIQSDNERIITLDINPRLNPTMIGDAEKLDEYFAPSSFDLIIADPPYDDNHTKYGTKKISKKKVVSLCSMVLKKGGYLVWLDTLIPQWRKIDGWEYKGNIGIAQSTNHKVRALTILQALGGKEHSLNHG